MGAMSSFIMFVALIFGGIAAILIALLVARGRYLSSGQEEGE